MKRWRKSFTFLTGRFFLLSGKMQVTAEIYYLYWGKEEYCFKLSFGAGVQTYSEIEELSLNMLCLVAITE